MAARRPWTLANLAAWTLCLVALAAGVVIQLLPEARGELLVPGNGWRVVRGFWREEPGRLRVGLRESVLWHPEARFWFASLEPPKGLRFIRSGPFEPSGLIAVPYQLAEPSVRSHVSDAGIWIRCIDSGATSRRPLRPTGLSISELLFELDRGFCDGPVEMRAVTSGREKFMVGTPFRIGRVELWKRSALAQVPRHAVICVGLLSIGLVCAMAVGGRVRAEHLPLVVLLGPLLAGLLSFFVYWLSPLAGAALSWLLVAGAPGLCAAVWFLDRQRLVRVLQPVAGALAVWVVVSFFFVLLLLSVDLNAGVWNPNARFWPVRWFMDNNLPLIVGEALYRGDSVHGLLFQWHVSDRPPLQTGVCLLFRPVASSLMGIGAAARVHSLYDIVGVVLSCSWAYATFLLCRLLGASRRSTISIIVVMALTPFCVFNSCYVWPKMLAGSLGLMALLVVLRPILERQRAEVSRQLPWVAACAAFSLLSHGATIFFLVAFAIWLLIEMRMPRVRHVIAGLAVGLALLGPWMLWQKLVDPPGNALVKSALAGSPGFGKKDRGVLDAVVEKYRETSAAEWLRLKQRHLVRIADGWISPKGVQGPLDTRRWQQFLYMGPSFGPFFLLALAALVGVPPWRRRPPAVQRTIGACRKLLGLALAALVISFLVQWHTHVIHHNSYAAFLLLLVASIVGGVLVARRLAMVVLAWSLVSTLLVWILDPLREVTARLDPYGLALGAVVLGAGLLHMLMDARRRWSHEAELVEG